MCRCCYRPMGIARIAEVERWRRYDGRGDHLDWLAFAVRWLHVITAIAWIGSSFYLVALDLGLN